jgi:hypothetical protein
VSGLVLEYPVATRVSITRPRLLAPCATLGPRLAILREVVSRRFGRGLAAQVEGVAAVVRCPADRERRRPARGREGIGLSSEEAGARHARPVGGLDHARTFGTCLRWHHEDEVDPLRLVQIRRLELTEIVVDAPCGAVQARAGIALRVPRGQVAIDPAATDDFFGRATLRPKETVGQEGRPRVGLTELSLIASMKSRARGVS